MNLEKPWVSVICLCYNHKSFVEEALNSVLGQSYSNVELIIVDDASTDGSPEVIRRFCDEHPDVSSILLEVNQGNCRAFNIGWRESKGKYIIDLAADDLLYPERIVQGVKYLEHLGHSYGVHFCDVNKIDPFGKTLGQHITSSYYSPVPEGHLFEELLQKYFINPVSMMISSIVLKELGGFDESLKYEDFDFWVRSSKQFKYCYTPEILVAKRVLKNSYSSRQYKFRSPMLETTLKVCYKAFQLCETENEFMALRKRVIFEMRKSFQSINLKMGSRFYVLLKQVSRRLKELS